MRSRDDFSIEKSWEIYINGGRTPTGIDAVKWAKRVEKLGAGEIECIALCKEHAMTFVTNDEKVKSAAQTLGIDVVDLNVILWYLKEERIVSKEELRKIINDIEVKDNTVLIGKESLLRD